MQVPWKLSGLCQCLFGRGNGSWETSPVSLLLLQGRLKCSQRCSFLECHKHLLSHSLRQKPKTYSLGVEHIRFPVYLLCKHGTGDLIMPLQVESWMMSHWYAELASHWHPWIAGVSISGAMPQWTFSLPPGYHINLLGNFSQPPPLTRLKPSPGYPVSFKRILPTIWVLKET